MSRQFAMISTVLAALGFAAPLTAADWLNLLIVLPDHGMSFPFSKATVYRNGTWSPLLFRWPGLPQPGRDTTNLVSSIDLLPTALEIPGLPAMTGIDSRTVLPLIRGASQPDRDYVVTHVNTVSSGKAFPQRCIRTRTHAGCHWRRLWAASVFGWSV